MNQVRELFIVHISKNRLALKMVNRKMVSETVRVVRSFVRRLKLYCRVIQKILWKTIRVDNSIQKDKKNIYDMLSDLSLIDKATFCLGA